MFYVTFWIGFGVNKPIKFFYMSTVMIFTWVFYLTKWCNVVSLHHSMTKSVTIFFLQQFAHRRYGIQLMVYYQNETKFIYFLFEHS